MPNLASAKKNLRKSKKRQKVRQGVKVRITQLLKRGMDQKGLQSLIDKAAKAHIFHKNKASRLISKLTKAR